MLRPQQGQVGHGIASALDAVCGIGDGLARQGGSSLGFDQEALDRGVEFFERGSAAGKGAAGAGEITEGIDSASGLPDKLRAGIEVVRADVAEQTELVRTEGVARAHDALSLALDEFEVSARHLAGPGAGQLIHQNHFRSQGGHHARPLNRVPARHDGHKRVALDSAHNGQACARIAAGQLHDGLPRPEQPGPFGILDDLACDAVFLGEPGVEVVELGQDTAARSPR